ncbi:MAG: GNAT family N-acetyltransferase [Ruminococcaceae bacterium]|nr:GNAT family N-acetyltransferase [Oscillospiraceae bacterium]
MKVLIGTTNPSKLRRFEELLSGHGIEFFSLRDLGIDTEPEETGNTPEENAAIKARFYGKYFDRVVCNDSGLYLDSLPLDDPRQPGLNVRAPEGKRLDDEEMIEYYSKLIASLGGKVLTNYLDGIAIYNCGKISTYMENSEATRASAFYMVSEPTSDRNPGWPLDSISINRNTMNYFTDKSDNKYDTTSENIMLGEYRQRLVEFMTKALGMEEFILTRPTGEYASQIAEYRQEFLDAGDSMDGTGPLRRIDDPHEYLKLCKEYESTKEVSAHLVPATQFLFIRKSDNRLVGMLQVRHCFNDYLEKYAGHIGYSVRPSERRKGYAKEMLKMALPFCRELGLNKVLITCTDGNIGSEKTILANGGVYESTVHEPNDNVDLKRFWITL